MALGSAELLANARPSMVADLLESERWLLASLRVQPGGSPAAHALWASMKSEG